VSKIVSTITLVLATCLLRLQRKNKHCMIWLQVR
jgi:hypothetical protein